MPPTATPEIPADRMPPTPRSLARRQSELATTATERPRLRRLRTSQQQFWQVRTAHAAALPVDSAEDLPEAGLPPAITPAEVAPGAVMPVARIVHVIHL